MTRLELADGRSVVLKVPPAGPPLLAYEAGMAAVEAAYLRLVAAHSRGAGASAAGRGRRLAGDDVPAGYAAAGAARRRRGRRDRPARFDRITNHLEAELAVLRQD